MLSDRLPQFMYDRLDPNDYNFRILTGSLKEAVQGTACAADSSGQPSQTINNRSGYGRSGNVVEPKANGSERSFTSYAIVFLLFIHVKTFF